MHLSHSPIGKALVLSCKAGEGLLRRGVIGVLTTSTGWIINTDTAVTGRPSVASVCFLDLARFYLSKCCNYLGRSSAEKKK
jgi:hypothetical protein